MKAKYRFTFDNKGTCINGFINSQTHFQFDICPEFHIIYLIKIVSAIQKLHKACSVFWKSAFPTVYQPVIIWTFTE